MGMHGECFTSCEGNHGHCDRNYPRCKENSTAYLAHLMEGGAGTPSPDFAGVEQMAHKEFLESGLPKWGKSYHTCGGVKGFGIYPFDIAVLYYDKTKWEPLHDSTGGCM